MNNDIDIEISRSEAHGRGRYEAKVPGNDAGGELTYTRLDDETVSADHTGVPTALRGQGIAKALVDRLIDDARADGFKIVPHCSYVRAQFDRHPEWSELRFEDN